MFADRCDRFKIREEDERDSTHQFHGILSVRFDSIKFFPQFDKASTETKDRKENIRNVIRTRLMQMRDGKSWNHSQPEETT